MKQRSGVQATLAFSLALLGALVMACGGGSSYGTSATAAPGATPPASEQQAATVRAVEGEGDPHTAWKFDPAQTTIRAGDTVSFTNTGKQAHTFTADDGSFDAGTLNPGETKPVKFDRQGSFPYHCSLHPWMTATIVVTATGADSYNNSSY